MMPLINLTPHDVVVHVDGTEITIPASGITSVVPTRRVPDGHVSIGGHDVAIRLTEQTGLPDLPSPRPGVLLVVARVVAERCRDRTDLVFPDDLVRDASGAVIGCRSFGRFGPPLQRE